MFARAELMGTISTKLRYIGDEYLSVGEQRRAEFVLCIIRPFPPLDQTT